MLDEEIKTIFDDRLILGNGGERVQRITKNLKEGMEKM